LAEVIRIVKTGRIRWAWHVACMRVKIYAYSVVIRQAKGKRALRRPRHLWEDNIKMDVKEID
jgi:hypothetical protein